MFRRYLLSPALTILALGLTAAPRNALATQPLADFLTQGHTKNYDALEQGAVFRQREREADVALGRLLPTVSARGVYTHNQYKSEIPAQLFGKAVVITPYNQLDAFFQVDVPIVDLSNFARRDQALGLAKVASIQRETTTVDVDRSIARAYYSFMGAAAQAAAADRSIQAAEENLNFVTARRELGTATELDLERAKANFEMAKQTLSDAVLSQTLTGRNLETLSGLSPTPTTDYPVDDLRPEEPLERWLGVRDTAPQRLQRELNEVSRINSKVADRAMLPTLAASAVQRFSNAAGFAGHGSTYQISATLSWRLDYSTYATAEAQSIASEVQQIREQHAQRGTEDAVFEAYHRVNSGIDKSTSIRAQLKAAEKAATLASERYAAGVATQLDVTQALRDQMTSEATRIQADAELAYARAALWIAAGKSAADHDRRFPRAPIQDATHGTGAGGTPPAGAANVQSGAQAPGAPTEAAAATAPAATAPAAVAPKAALNGAAVNADASVAASAAVAPSASIKPGAAPRPPASPPEVTAPRSVPAPPRAVQE